MRINKLNYKRKDRVKQLGFTLIEVMIVLVIALGIYGIASGKIASALGWSSDTEEDGNISQLYSNAKALKTASGYGASGTNLVLSLISAKGIPGNMTVTSNVPYNDWGGAVTVVSTGQGFTIGYSDVPQDACIKIATKANKGGTFASVQVNSATAQTSEYTSAQAQIDCSSSTNNTMTFTSSS